MCTCLNVITNGGGDGSQRDGKAVNKFKFGSYIILGRSLPKTEAGRGQAMTSQLQAGERQFQDSNERAVPSCLLPSNC